MSELPGIQRDSVVDAFGIAVEAVSIGSARVSMTVTTAMLNLHGTCHGGVIFTLADSALGYSSNAEGPLAVATGGDINFLRPARLGDRLVAEARQRHRTRRTALFDIEVRNVATTHLVAIFTGRIGYPQIAEEAPRPKPPE